MHNCPTVPFDDRYQPGTSPEEAAQQFYEVMRKRRSVRMFSDKPVSKEKFEALIQRPNKPHYQGNTHIHFKRIKQTYFNK